MSKNETAIWVNKENEYVNGWEWIKGNSNRQQYQIY